MPRPLLDCGTGPRTSRLLGGPGLPGYVAVAIGTFADPAFPPPTIAVWEEARHHWVELPPDVRPKRVPKQG